MASQIEKNLSEIKQKTDKYNAKIVAVTKYYSIDKMVEAYNAGLRDFGESRLPDAVKKINSLDDEINSKSTYHLIGHLQTNKTKWAVGNFKLIHSIDSIKLANEVSNQALSLGIKQEVLIQVNNAGEEQKFGVAPSQLEEILIKASELKGIKVVGLMNVAPLTDDRGLLDRLFKEMRNLKEQYKLNELSMGMSSDYEIALENGATIVRLGRKLFEKQEDRA